jgi:hypothetical protein
VNPYAAATAHVPPRPPKAAGAFPQLNAMMVSGALSAVLETLDHWQRMDPMDEHLRLNAPDGFDANATPVNRIPWIHAAVGSQVTDEASRSMMDVIGFVFDYLFHDPSIPLPFRKIFDGLQVPILKAALLDPSIFTDKKNSARRLLDGLAFLAICAEDDEAYGTAFYNVASSIVASVRAEYVMDADVFVYAFETLGTFASGWKQKMSRAMQPQVDVALASETRDADRSRVRVLIRDKLSGIDVPFDIRVFGGTVWTDYLTRLRQAEGTRSEAYSDAVKVLDDMLWSITAKRRTGQKARLSTMIPPIVRGLRAGAAVLQVSEEKMESFLGVLYNLHMMAINPAAAGTAPVRKTGRLAETSSSTTKQIENLYDFVADLVLGTWLAFDQGGSLVKLRLNWISPWRATYIFANRSGSVVLVFTPEELAWEMSTGRATLILEPVPLFDRAMSVTLEYLAGQKAKQDAGRSDMVENRPSNVAEKAAAPTA